MKPRYTELQLIYVHRQEEYDPLASLTIILRARVGYEMIDSQQGATRLVGYNHLISNKRE